MAEKDDQEKPTTYKAAGAEEVTGTRQLRDTILKIGADGVENGENPSFSPNDSKSHLEHKFRGAALEGHVEIMNEMLSEGLVEVNCAHPQTKQTALHSACTGCNLNSVEFLLEKEGIKVDVKDIYGNSPLDLLTNGKDSSQIREMINSKLGSSDGMENLGTITPISKISGGKFTNHVYLIHDFKDRVAAQKVKEKMENVGVSVTMTKSMMADASQVKKDVEKSKMVVILSSKTMMKKLEDPMKFSRSGCVIEMDSSVNEKDPAEILIVAIDSSCKSLEVWRNCPDYEFVSDEGLIFDFSNEKAINENFPSFFKELKIRATS